MEISKEKENEIKEKIKLLLESNDEEFRILGSKLLEFCELKTEDKLILIVNALDTFVNNNNNNLPSSFQNKEFIESLVNLNNELYKTVNIFKKRVNHIK